MSTPPFLELPACARPARLDTPRGPVAAHVAEPSGHPRGTALLVPGFTGSKEDFIGVLAPLAERGWRVVAVDQRGQHETPGPDDPDAYDVPALAHDVLAMVSALDDGPVHLLGHSFGGLVVRSAVITDPSVFRSLTLLCTGPSSLPLPRREPLEQLRQALAAGVDLETVWTVVRQREESSGRAQPPAPVLDFLHRRYVANAATGLRRMAEQLLASPDETERLRDVVRSADLPVLVAWGEQDDAWTPEEQKVTADRLGARAEQLDGLGHSPAADSPAVTADLLDSFWSSVSDDA